MRKKKPRGWMGSTLLLEAGEGDHEPGTYLYLSTWETNVGLHTFLGSTFLRGLEAEIRGRIRGGWRKRAAGESSLAGAP